MSQRLVPRVAKLSSVVNERDPFALSRWMHKGKADSGPLPRWPRCLKASDHIESFPSLTSARLSLSQHPLCRSTEGNGHTSTVLGRPALAVWPNCQRAENHHRWETDEVSLSPGQRLQETLGVMEPRELNTPFQSTKDLSSKGFPELPRRLTNETVQDFLVPHPITANRAQNSS